MKATRLEYRFRFAIHGLLFGLACIVFVCSLAVLVLHRKDLPLVGSRL